MCLNLLDDYTVNKSQRVVQEAAGKTAQPYAASVLSTGGMMDSRGVRATQDPHRTEAKS